MKPTIQPLLLLLALLQVSGLGLGQGLRGQDEEEGLVTALLDAVMVQGLAVAGQTLVDHPALQCRVEAVFVIELQCWRGKMYRKCGHELSETRHHLVQQTMSKALLVLQCEW